MYGVHGQFTRDTDRDIDMGMAKRGETGLGRIGMGGTAANDEKQDPEYKAPTVLAHRHICSEAGMYPSDCISTVCWSIHSSSFSDHKVQPILDTSVAVP